MPTPLHFQGKPRSRVRRSSAIATRRKGEGKDQRTSEELGGTAACLFRSLRAHRTETISYTPRGTIAPRPVSESDRLGRDVCKDVCKLRRYFDEKARSGSGNDVRVEGDHRHRTEIGGDTDDRESESYLQLGGGRRLERKRA